MFFRPSRMLEVGEGHTLFLNPEGPVEEERQSFIFQFTPLSSCPLSGTMTGDGDSELKRCYQRIIIIFWWTKPGEGRTRMGVQAPWRK